MPHVFRHHETGYRRRRTDHDEDCQHLAVFKTEQRGNRQENCRKNEQLDCRRDERGLDALDSFASGEGRADR